jgi:hypothetical protein
MQRKNTSATLVFWYTDTPGLNATLSYAASELTKISKVKNKKEIKFLKSAGVFLVEKKAQRGEGGGGVLLCDNSRRGG